GTIGLRTWAIRSSARLDRAISIALRKAARDAPEKSDGCRMLRAMGGLRSVEMTGHDVLGRDGLELGRHARALLHRERTARVEVTAGRRIDRRGHLAAQDHVLARRVRVG